MSIDRDHLPVPDYDHLPLGELRHRIRSLDVSAVSDLIQFETAHGNRLPVLEVLRTRRTDLEAGTQPSDGDPEGRNPASAPPADGGSKVAGTKVQGGNPPPHGNPLQAAKPKGDRIEPI